MDLANSIILILFYTIFHSLMIPHFDLYSAQFFLHHQLPFLLFDVICLLDSQNVYKIFIFFLSMGAEKYFPKYSRTFHDSVSFFFVFYPQNYLSILFRAKYGAEKEYYDVQSHKERKLTEM